MGIACACGLLLLGWCIGFLWFQVELQRPPPPLPPRVDGVVALTGGAGRISRALQVLADGRADKLLITGIGGNADQTALAHEVGVDLSPLASRITFGHYAASTHGNAVETAAWATQNNIRSLIVVTAVWHMPRALVELRRALPDIAFYPLPILPEAAGFRLMLHSLRIRAEEFTKYLLVVARVSNFLPQREADTLPAHEAIIRAAGPV